MELAGYFIAYRQNSQLKMIEAEAPITPKKAAYTGLLSSEPLDIAISFSAKQLEQYALDKAS